MKKKSLSAKKKIHNLILKHLNNKDILKIYNEFKKPLNIKKRYAVAISGGPDSLALAYLSKCFEIHNNTKFYYFIVDHKLRKESSKEAKKVLSILKKFQIKCKILTWKGKKPSSNIQSIARNKRYSLLTNECEKNRVHHLLLGHHIDDLYENFLLRLLRGSGLKGLTSMDKFSENRIKGIQILRPFINIKKLELIKISKKVFGFFVKDPSNINENFKRIRIRNLIQKLEEEGLDKKKLKLTINNLKDSNKTIKFYVRNNIEQNSAFLENKKTCILNKNFLQQPSEIIFRSLSDIMRKVGNKYYSARGKSISNLISKLKSQKLKKTTLGGCLIEKVNETVLISREKSLKS